MAGGFSVSGSIPEAAGRVWAYLTDFNKVHQPTRGVTHLRQAVPGPLEVGLPLCFQGKRGERDTRVTVLEPGEHISLTTAGRDGVELTLDAALAATGYAPIRAVNDLKS